MNEPRPTTISARPRDSRSSVANCWKSRTGSIALSTVTALVSRMRRVRAAAAARMIGRGRIQVFLAMVFADAEDVEPDLVGMFDLLQQLAHSGQPGPQTGWSRCRRRRSCRCQSAREPPIFIFSIHLERSRGRGQPDRWRSSRGQQRGCDPGASPRPQCRPGIRGEAPTTHGPPPGSTDPRRRSPPAAG